MSYNDTHPELRTNEYFYMNIPVQRKGGLKANIKRHFPGSKVRFGKKAYSPSGKRVAGFVPVFRKW